MQQHIAPRLDVLGFRVLDLVVADAVLAGDEDHAAGCELGHVDGVVPCTRDGGHVAVAQLGGGAAHGLHTLGWKSCAG